MAILSKEKFMEKLKSLIGDSTDDSALTALEDFTDTYNHLESMGSGTATALTEQEKETIKKEMEKEWQKKVDDKEAEWRQKYRDRFFGAEDTDTEPESGGGRQADSGLEPETEPGPEDARLEDAFLGVGETLGEGEAGIMAGASTGVF